MGETLQRHPAPRRRKWEDPARLYLSYHDDDDDGSRSSSGSHEERGARTSTTPSSPLDDGGGGGGGDDGYVSEASATAPLVGANIVADSFSCASSSSMMYSEDEQSVLDDVAWSPEESSAAPVLPRDDGGPERILLPVNASTTKANESPTGKQVIFDPNATIVMENTFLDEEEDEEEEENSGEEAEEDFHAVGDHYFNPGPEDQGAARRQTEEEDTVRKVLFADESGNERKKVETSSPKEQTAADEETRSIELVQKHDDLTRNWEGGSFSETLEEARHEGEEQQKQLLPHPQDNSGGSFEERTRKGPTSRSSPDSVIPPKPPSPGRSRLLPRMKGNSNDKSNQFGKSSSEGRLLTPSTSPLDAENPGSGSKELSAVLARNKLANFGAWEEVVDGPQADDVDGRSKRISDNHGGLEEKAPDSDRLARKRQTSFLDKRMLQEELESPRATADEIAVALGIEAEGRRLLRHARGRAGVIDEDGTAMDAMNNKEDQGNAVPVIHIMDDIWMPHYEEYVMKSVLAFSRRLLSIEKHSTEWSGGFRC
jgi:hypothetical protein